jgi:hypothetical protein
VKELVFPCDIFSSELQLGSLVSWPIKKMVDFNIGSFLNVEIINQFEGSMTQMNQNHNIKFMGEKVNLVHQCSSQPNYIARGIISNVFGRRGGALCTTRW